MTSEKRSGIYLTGYSKSKPTLICFAGLCYSEPIIGMGLWQKLTNKTRENPPLFFFNTLTKSKELFTLPSWGREAFGIVYVEAMASGLPVVAPNDPPRREIIGDAGIFVNDVNDQQNYGDAIQKALSKKWGDIPRKQAEKFSWDKIAAQYEKLFKQLLDK